MDSLLHSTLETYLLDEEHYFDNDTPSIRYEKELSEIKNFPEGFFSEL